MAAKRLTKSSVDWVNLIERCPDVQKSSFQTFRAKCEAQMRKALTLPEQPPKIDWSFYKANVSDKSLIESFEKQYNALKVPYHKADAALAEIDKEAKEVEEHVAKFVAESKKRAEQFKKDLELIKNCISYDEMTLEEFYYAHNDYAYRPLTHPSLSCCRDVEDDYTNKELAILRKRKFVHGPDEYHP